MPNERETGNVPEECRQCKHWNRSGHAARVRALLEQMTARFEEKLASQEFKLTVAEYLKILEAERDLVGGEEAKEMVVSWTDPVSSNT